MTTMEKTKQKKVPRISQNDETESGAASLCMILAAYGRYVGLSEMRNACKVSRDGCRLSNLMDAAENYGMKAEGVQCDASLEGVSFPAIALWEQDHWLVIEEKSEKGIRLVDPALAKDVSAKKLLQKAFPAR